MGLVLCVLGLCVVPLWSRLVSPPSMADVRALAEQAPIVFRGRVAEVRAFGVKPHQTIPPDSIATIEVDRLYRGKAGSHASVYFAYGVLPTGINGHYCIDFQPDSYWLVFAVEKNGRLELFDDCEGALAISSRLGSNLKDASWLAQMEADFLAGLDDRDPAARIVSMQRVGGLKLPSSRDALHRVIAEGDETQTNWAVYAALRTGDISVLPRVKEMLSSGDSRSPEREIAFELQNISDRKAVPDLIAILESATGDLTPSRVLIALAEKIKDPRSVPTLAAHLSDSREGSQYLALEGLKSITHETACTLPDEPNAQSVEQQTRRCKAWWEAKGKFQAWTRN
jgi:hypothetical protein